jgi:hypothetical protein
MAQRLPVVFLQGSSEFLTLLVLALGASLLVSCCLQVCLACLRLTVIDEMIPRRIIVRSCFDYSTLRMTALTHTTADI